MIGGSHGQGIRRCRWWADGCAGSPLATLLARAGLSVALVEQATFPRDTLSTHIFESAALAFLKRLGVLSAVRATGAPIVNHVDIRQEGFRARVPVPQQPGDVGGAMSVRRLLLDPILMGGGRPRPRPSLDGREGDRARQGPRPGNRHARRPRRVRAGAGGQAGGLRRQPQLDGGQAEAGSRRLQPNLLERFAYWSFFEGADPGPEPTVVFHRSSSNLSARNLTASGLSRILALPELGQLPRSRQSLEESLLRVRPPAATR